MEICVALSQVKVQVQSSLLVLLFFTPIIETRPKALLHRGRCGVIFACMLTSKKYIFFLSKFRMSVVLV